MQADMDSCAMDPDGRGPKHVSVVVLTFNSEAVIADTLRAASSVSDDVHVVDSFSSDLTRAIAENLGATIHTRRFNNYADQRNWAISNLKCRHDWQLHLDADEIISTELIEEIHSLMRTCPRDVDGFFIPRLIRFMGRDLRHGGYYPIYHMRLFRSGSAYVEDRLYDQHFVLQGRGLKLKNPFVDDHRMPISEWIARHNRWSDLEVIDLSRTQTTSISAEAMGDPIQRARFRKKAYYRLPPFARAFALFMYRFFLRFGFLDGKPGLIYCFLQCLWFRFLVDAKLYEAYLNINVVDPPCDALSLSELRTRNGPNLPNPRETRE